MIMAGTRLSARPSRLALPRPRRGHRRLPAAALAVLLVSVGFAAGMGAGASAALLVSSASSAGNVFTAGTWVPATYFLHNDPTPPTGPTVAKTPLKMDENAPTATVLYNYDTDVDSGPGRSVARGGSSPNEVDPLRYAAWRSPALTTALTLNGQVAVTLWTAIPNFRGGRTGAIAVYLRDLDPGSGGYVELGSLSRTTANWQKGSSGWIVFSGNIAVSNRTLPVGHVLEVKVEVPSTSQGSMWLAYDMVGLGSNIQLP